MLTRFRKGGYSQSTIEALCDLKITYRRYFNNPNLGPSDRWDSCETCFNRAVAKLTDGTVTSVVDTLITSSRLWVQWSAGAKPRTRAWTRTWLPMPRP